MTYSGFEKVNASKTDVWKVLGEGADLTRYTSQTDTGINAIDRASSRATTATCG